MKTSSRPLWLMLLAYLDILVILFKPEAAFPFVDKTHQYIATQGFKLFSQERSAQEISSNWEAIHQWSAKANLYTYTDGPCTSNPDKPPGEWDWCHEPDGGTGDRNHYWDGDTDTTLSLPWPNVKASGYGSSQTFTIAPDGGYHVKNVLADGSPVGPQTVYTFTDVTADHTIAATFEPDSFKITATAGEHGSITPSGEITVSYGGEQTFTITPEAGYHIKDVRVDGVSKGAITTHTFSDVSSDHTILAAFEIDSITITASAGEHGSIQPTGAVEVDFGVDQTFTITPETGYCVKDVLVDDAPYGNVASYTFHAVSCDHTISVSFEACMPPFADAGPDQKVSEGALVMLSGANSTDPDEGIASYRWEQVAGISVELADPSAREATFIAPSVGEEGASLTFKLTVADIEGIESTDGCIVNVTRVNEPPNADAGIDQQVSEGATVTLNGSSSTDPDDGIAAYLWSQVSEPSVELTGADTDEPTFLAPDAGPSGASLTFQLVVTDRGGLQSADTCIVNVGLANQPPTAQAGPAQNVGEGALVSLDGSSSFDPDDGIAYFRWTQLTGAPVTLADPTASTTAFTAPSVGPEGASLRFQLTVTDQGGLKSTAACIVNVTWVNEPPRADAGPDQQVSEGATVTLDGSNSSDPDGGIRTYLWTQTAGPTVVLAGADSAKAEFSAPDVGPEGVSLTFQLTVSDQGGLQATDTCIVNVGWVNQPPTAQAAPDQDVSEGAQVILNGSNSRDQDDGIASFLWTQLTGSPVMLADPTAALTSFTAPDVGQSGESLTFQLTVTDHGGLQSSDTCIVNVSWVNEPPEANAGADQEVSEGATVTLDGSGSLDPEGGIIAYAWKQTRGPQVSLSDPTSSSPTFTAPDAGPDGVSLTFQLTVRDEGGLQSTDTCIVSVSWVNSPPIADAGEDISAEERDIVVLDGSMSDDPDDGIAGYSWTQESGPPVTLSDPASVSPDFTVPSVPAGETIFRFRLTVTDNHGLSSSDTCLCTVHKDLPEVQITAPDATASEPGANTGLFKIMRTGDKSAKLKVQLGISGTARNGVDYAKIRPTIVIPAGSSYISIKSPACQ